MSSVAIEKPKSPGAEGSQDSEAPRPKGRGVLPGGSVSRPVRNNGHFNKAPLDPALKGGAYGEQSGKRPKDTEPKKDNERRSKKKVNSNRKCKICGGNPYPNYFFCPSCHHRIEVYEEGDE